MEYITDILSISSDGNGVGRVDGRVVFVPYTVTGDTVKIRIETEKPRFLRASITDVLSPSQDRITPDCPVYGQCGGCVMRHMTYDAELRAKREAVENAMQRIGGFADFSLSGITGMDKPERYRNKTVFHAEKGRLGFYAPKSHELIKVCDCLIGISENKAIIQAVEEYIRESGTDKIQSVFVRKAFSTGEIMLVISADGKLQNTDILAVKLAGLNVKSIILNSGNKYTTLFGKNTIDETLCGIKFEISPESFFQVNPAQTEKLYNKALEFADIKANDTVLDIYCGAGTISLCAAKRAGKVIGVEVVGRAIEDAKKNARGNNIKNAYFYAGKAENIVPALIKNGEKPDIVILDPPRSGSDKKTLGAAVTANPKKIVYVSCNPATLARDARFLAENGYEISAAEAFDMFPRTSHVETVVLFKK